jgi:flavin-dependent dehydrogenase
VSNSRFDCCILGGGLAGSACAILLARSGAHVLLVERHGFEAYRPGEHFAPAVLGALAVLDPPVTELRKWVEPSPGIVSRWALETPLFRPYLDGDDSVPALNVTRASFEKVMFDHALASGVEGRIGSRLVRAEREGSRWTLHFADPQASCRADFVVDATGRSAIFARRRGSVRKTFGDQVAIAAVLPAESTDSYHARNLVVEAISVGWWSVTFDGTGRLIATLFSRASERRCSGLSCAEWWERGLGETRLVRDIVRPPIRAGAVQVVAPAFPALVSPGCGQGWVAIGDALAAYDPICGHGVVHALESAFRAAEAIGHAGRDSYVWSLFDQAIGDRMAEHLTKRAEAYGEAAHRFASPFWRELSAA